MLGQVSWVPNADSAFFGIDTNGVPIGMLAYGNDDVWSGTTYNVDDQGDGLIITDTWMWALAIPCQIDLDCADDDDICTDQVCVDGFCDYPYNTAPCDDGDACTDQDACSEGECVAVDVECEDANLCSVDACDVMLGCVNELIDGCCLADGDCPEGEVCLVGSNSCIPDEGGDGDGDTGDGDGDPGDGDGDGDPGDGDGDTGDGDGDTGDGNDSTGDESAGDDTGGTTTSGVSDEQAGCNCAMNRDTNPWGALLGSLVLLLLGSVRKRKHPAA
jgi:MYXO-CTERM domain-containing protein